MKRFNWIISISRPRFWSYLAGPWAVGMVSAANSIYDFQNILFWLGLLFFLWPANFLLYGINDYTDRDTVNLTPRKKTTKSFMNIGKILSFGHCFQV